MPRLGLLLVDHGSRRAEANQALAAQAALVARLRPDCAVEHAHMELAEPAIAAGVAALRARGCDRLLVLPCFLGPGRHLSEDIPRLLAEAMAGQPALAWSMGPPLAPSDGLAALLVERASVPAGHGIYLDWNATAPLSPAARAAWLAAQDAAGGNPASGHLAGQRARHALDLARRRLAAALGCQAEGLVLTSGGTEAIAQAIHAACALRPGGRIAALAIEHPAVHANAAARAPLDLLAVGGDGRAEPAALATALRPGTALLCIQAANNEIGTLQDVAACAAAARAACPGLLVLADCCQAAGRIPLDLARLGADFATIAGHKFGAPKGVGLLWARAGLRPAPLLGGGGQQQDRRSGTEDVAGAAACAAALEQAVAGLAAEGPRQSALLDAVADRLAADLPGLRRLGCPAARLPNTLSLAHPGLDSRALAVRLDLRGFCVSPGAACASGGNGPSRTVTALGLGAATANGALRVSIGPATTSAELEGFAEAYAQEAREMLG